MCFEHGLAVVGRGVLRPHELALLELATKTGAGVADAARVVVEGVDGRAQQRYELNAKVAA